MKSRLSFAGLAIILLVCLSADQVMSKRAHAPILDNVNANDVVMNCLPILEGFIAFDLSGIPKEQASYTAKLEDNKTAITWTVCDSLKNTCPDGKPAFAIVNTVDNETTTCQRITSDNSSGISWSLKNSSEPQAGIVYKFVGGEAESTFKITLECEKDSNFTLVGAGVDEAGKNYWVAYKGKYGCPTVNPNELWKIFVNNTALVAVVGVILGALLCFVGYKLSKPAFFLFGFMITFLPIMYFFFAYVGTKAEPDTKWVVAGIAALIGILFGVISVRLEKVGYFVVGVALSYAVSTFVVKTFLASIQYGNYIIIGATAFGGLVIGLLMAKYKDAFLMVTTSFVGAYLFVRPLFLIFDPKLNEFEIADKIRIGELTSVPFDLYLLLGSWLVVAIAGFYLQVTRRMAEKRSEHDPPEYLSI